MNFRSFRDRVISKLNRMKGRKWNTVIDHYCVPVVSSEEGLAISQKEFSRVDVESWLIQGNLNSFVQKDWFQKKGLEFFFTAHLLQIKPHDSLLDAAGGRSGYLSALRLNGHKGEHYLTDQIFDGIKKIDKKVNIVGGDITAINLPDTSIDKIACHHAFEHFQGDKDIRFIEEIDRILKFGGMAVITPIFIADKYIECWNIPHQKKFDDLAELVIDETASIPGADEDGHFARIYDVDALERRVLSPARQLGLDICLVELFIDGQLMPDMNNNFGSKLNKPLRALILNKEK